MALLIKEMREKLAQLDASMKNLVDSAETSSEGRMTQEEELQFEKLKQDNIELRKQIARRETIEHNQAEADRSIMRSAPPALEVRQPNLPNFNSEEWKQ